MWEMTTLKVSTHLKIALFPSAGTARMNFFDLANLLDNDGNLQVCQLDYYPRAMNKLRN